MASPLNNTTSPAFQDANASNEDRFRSLTAAAFEGIGISENGKVVDINDQLAQMLGYSREELIGQNVSMMVAPESRGFVAQAMQSGQEGPYEHKAMRKDGSVFEAEVRAKTIEWAGRPVRVTAVRDVSEGKRSEEALKRQVAFAEVMTRVLTGFATCTMTELDAAITSGLGEIARFIGADHAYVVLSSHDKTWDVTHEWCGSGVARQFENYQQLPFGVQPWGEAMILSGQIVRLNTLADLPSDAVTDLQRIRGEGARSVLTVPIRGVAGRVNGAVGLHSHSQEVVWRDVDVSSMQMLGNAIASLLERKRAEITLREVSRRLHQAQNEERRRIARELHDSTAQQLAAVMMNLGMLEDCVQPRRGKAGKLVQDSLGLVEKCSQDVRTVSYLLHPPLLDQMGLAAAMGNYIEGFSKRSGIKVALQISAGPARLPPEIELTIFRLIQEALGNIHRHSGSTTASVRLASEPDRIVLEVKDEGKGMRAETVQALREGLAVQGVGLAAMKERLGEVGGQLDVESRANGTCLRAVVPLSKETM